MTPISKQPAATLKSVELCVLWIKATQMKTKTLRRVSSYSYKHRVEAFARGMGEPCYIPEAAFLKAAQFLDFKTRIKKIGRNETAYFAMTDKKGPREKLK